MYRYVSFLEIEELSYSIVSYHVFLSVFVLHSFQMNPNSKNKNLDELPPFCPLIFWVTTKWKTTIFFGNYGGLTGIKNLPLIYEKKSVFEFWWFS